MDQLKLWCVCITEDCAAITKTAEGLSVLVGNGLQHKGRKPAKCRTASESAASVF